MTVAANVRDFLAGLTVSLDPVERFRAAIGEPDPFQVEILRSDPANEPQDAMLCCVASRQIGKSTAIAALAWDDATRGKTVLIACPSLRQSTELLRRVVEFKSADPFAPKVVRQVQTEIETMNGGRIISIPATDNARGMTCNTLILDEAAFHEDEAITALLPMRRSTGRTLMISTPNGRQGFFWEVFSEKKARIIFARSVDSMRPDVLSKVEYDRRFMADFRFRQEHLCEFLSGNGTQLISWDTLSRATDNTEKALVL